MSISIEMPKLSDTMTEGTLVRWIKKVGDKVQTGDVLAEVETDKATMEMEAFDDGTLAEILVQDGEKVEVGQALAVLLEPGEEGGSKSTGKKQEAEPQTKPEKPAKETAKKSAPPPAEETKAEETEAEEAAKAEPEEKKEAKEPGDRVKASPLAKKIAAELNLDLREVTGTGPGGRIVRADVMAVKAAPKEAAKAGATAPQSVSPARQVPTAQDQRIVLSGMRRTIAARLLEAKTTIPHFYLQAEVDVERLVKLRQELNASLEAASQPKITVNDFILKATAVAATQVPKANASFQGEAILQYGSVQLACAVALEEGLITPVIRDAQTKSLTEISASIKDLAGRARAKKLKPEEFQGGTITVSNLGSYGVEQFFAIINPPGAVIVSVGSIVKKPVVNEGGQIVVGQRIVLGISCDHRVVDGAIGAHFLAELKRLIEHPALMLI